MPTIRSSPVPVRLASPERVLLDQGARPATGACALLGCGSTHLGRSGVASRLADAAQDQPGLDVLAVLGRLGHRTAGLVGDQAGASDVDPGDRVARPSPSSPTRTVMWPSTPAACCSRQTVTASPRPATPSSSTWTDRESLGNRPMVRYDVEVIITRISADSLVEWTIHGTIKPPIGHVYGCELTPDPEGTRVTSYYDWSGAADQWKHAFPVIDEKSLRASLGILERAVVRGYPRPGGAS